MALVLMSTYTIAIADALVGSLMGLFAVPLFYTACEATGKAVFCRGISTHDPAGAALRMNVEFSASMGSLLFGIVCYRFLRKRNHLLARWFLGGICLAVLFSFSIILFGNMSFAMD